MRICNQKEYSGKKEYLSMQELERQINQDQSGFNGLKKGGKMCRLSVVKREGKLISCTVLSHRVTFRGNIVNSVTDYKMANT